MIMLFHSSPTRLWKTEKVFTLDETRSFKWVIGESVMETDDNKFVLKRLVLVQLAQMSILHYKILWNCRQAKHVNKLSPLRNHYAMPPPTF